MEKSVHSVTSVTTWRRVFIIAAFALIPGIVIVAGDGNALVCRGTLLEDAFYYLTIARNLVTGHGFALDAIHPTNGLHPLQLVFLLPGAAFLSEWEFIRYSLWIGILTHVGTSAALYLMCRRIVTDNAAFAIGIAWAAAISSRLSHYNGLETGLFLFFAVLVSWFYLSIRDQIPNKQQAAKLGFLLGICYFARIDAVFLGIAIATDLLLRYRKAAFRVIGKAAAISALVVVPWFVVSGLVTDGIIPDSGPATHYLALRLGAPWYRGNTPVEILPKGSFDQHPVAWRGINLAFFGVSSAMWSPSFSWVLGWSHADFYSRWRDKKIVQLLFTAPILLALSVVMLVTITSILGRRYRIGFLATAALLQWIAYAILPTPPWFSTRYCILIICVWTILGIGILHHLLPNRHKVALGLIGFIWLLANWVQTVALYPYPSEPERYLKEAYWLRDNLPHEAIVASFQSGILSYFSGHRVVNLDGVVNRYALQAVKKRKLGLFLRRAGVTHVADMRIVLNMFFWPNLGNRGTDRYYKLRKDWFDVWSIRGLSSDKTGVESFER